MRALGKSYTPQPGCHYLLSPAHTYSQHRANPKLYHSFSQAQENPSLLPVPEFPKETSLPRPLNGGQRDCMVNPTETPWVGGMSLETGGQMLVSQVTRICHTLLLRRFSCPEASPVTKMLPLLRSSTFNTTSSIKPLLISTHPSLNYIFFPLCSSVLFILPYFMACLRVCKLRERDGTRPSLADPLFGFMEFESLWFKQYSMDILDFFVVVVKELTLHFKVRPEC